MSQFLFQIRDDDDDVIEELLINSCTCNSPKTWVMLICCLKGIVLTFGVFLSWETRNVHCLQPNDSKNTGLAVYNVLMFSCLALVVMFVETYPPIEMLIERTIVFVGTTSTICLLFLPKVRKNFSIWVTQRRTKNIKKPGRITAKYVETNPDITNIFAVNEIVVRYNGVFAITNKFCGTVALRYSGFPRYL